MQSLARDGLSAAQVTALLQSPALEVSAGLELLAPDLSLVEDISDDLADGKVSHNLHATIHRTCDLSLSRELLWGVDLVRPYMVLSDGAVSARFDVGVFCLTTPERQVGQSPETYSVQGFDRLMLLNRQVGADYTVTAGTTYRAAVIAAHTAAGLSGVLIEGSAADDVLPADKTWPLVGDNQADPDQTTTPVTWLRVVNDLLRAIRFRAVWCDESGLFRCESYQDPASRAPEFVLDADDVVSGIVGQRRTLMRDVWKVPNRWVFRATNFGTGIEGDGVYTVDLSDTANGDWLGRRLVENSVIDYEAASQAKLVSLGDDRVASDQRVAQRLSYSTGPLPAAGHADVLSLRDSAAGLSVKVHASGWSMDLSGSDVDWDLEVVG